MKTINEYSDEELKTITDNYPDAAELVVFHSAYEALARLNVIARRCLENPDDPKFNDLAYRTKEQIDFWLKILEEDK